MLKIPWITITDIGLFRFKKTRVERYMPIIVVIEKSIIAA
jgi:hypothetical protein